MKAFLTIVLVVFMSLSSQAQEKRIKFSKGTLKVCSKRQIRVIGYDGDEIIIKKKGSRMLLFTTKNEYEKKSEISYAVAMRGYKAGKLGSNINKSATNASELKKHLTNYSNINSNLKRLGGKSGNVNKKLDFVIERKNKEITIKDTLQKNDLYEMLSSAKVEYEFKIPNSIKLVWDTEKCRKENTEGTKKFYYKKSYVDIEKFNGELEVSVSLNDVHLTDVAGPVSVNSIGGNIMIWFLQKEPTKLYSVYSNNGYIELRVPDDSNLLINASGSSIYSDLDKIKVLKDNNSTNAADMKLKLNKGLVRMNLDAGYGNVYLRKDDLDLKKAAN